jgi:hypothetical protein
MGMSTAVVLPFTAVVALPYIDTLNDQKSASRKSRVLLCCRQGTAVAAAPFGSYTSLIVIESWPLVPLLTANACKPKLHINTQQQCWQR